MKRDWLIHPGVLGCFSLVKPGCILPQGKQCVGILGWEMSSLSYCGPWCHGATSTTFEQVLVVAGS